MSQPKADFGLFDSNPNTIFLVICSIVGFTAWSSVREPSQVFTLLESLYMSFDNVAKARRIFKIETVGDCYVAASGMPQARADHAVSMVRFANDILQRMQVITRELEVKLGPDTADLSLRVGIHSGPVTGGILRGQKARFQLFGDTMNTCSRIEASSRPGRIHLSQATAEHLIKAGKTHWLQKRSETISAKASKASGLPAPRWAKMTGRWASANRSIRKPRNGSATSSTLWNDVTETFTRANRLRPFVR